MMKKLLLLIIALVGTSAYSQAPAGFVVTSPNTNVTWQGALNKTVSWNTAGTQPDVPFVDILLSTDGGTTYPVALASKVPNDGSEIIVVPDLPGTQNRIKVRKHNDDTFADASNADFIITAAGNTMAINFEGDRTVTACVGNSITVNVDYQVFNGFSQSATLFVIDAPGNPYGTTPVPTFNPVVNAAGNISITFYSDINVEGGVYPVTIMVTSGNIVKIMTIYINFLPQPAGFWATPSNYTLLSPENVTLTWVMGGNFYYYVSDIISFDVDVATDANFENIVSSGTVTISSYTVGALPEGAHYYWRINATWGDCSSASENFEFYTGFLSCNEYVSEDTPIILPENTFGYLTSIMAVSANEPIFSVNVNVDITHSLVSDLTIVLVSPAGTEVTLYNQSCPDAQNINATFSDTGSDIICGTDPAISGFVLPQTSLSAFNGESSFGVWTLFISDWNDLNEGSLNNWSLDICTVDPPLSVTDVAFNSLALYPNPNSGDFTVRFNPVAQGAVNINVYDMRGRQVLTKAYANTGGVFEQNLSLSNAQAGIYLVHVQQGSSTVTKKIVVQ